jgi:hypothetical protein
MDVLPPMYGRSCGSIPSVGGVLFGAFPRILVSYCKEIACSLDAGLSNTIPETPHGLIAQQGLVFVKDGNAALETLLSAANLLTVE